MCWCPEYFSAVPLYQKVAHWLEARGRWSLQVVCGAVSSELLDSGNTMRLWDGVWFWKEKMSRSEYSLKMFLIVKTSGVLIRDTLCYCLFQVHILTLSFYDPVKAKLHLKVLQLKSSFPDIVRGLKKKKSCMVSSKFLSKTFWLWVCALFREGWIISLIFQES